MPPLFDPKRYTESSRFQVENLLREARRQRGLSDSPVPAVCLLDPDGDVVRHLRATGDAERDRNWACYHSELWVTDRPRGPLGIVPCAVGAPYAVLVAEELHASGCNLLVSITSAGQILAIAAPPYFVLIERAWRDEGTSLHYLPPSEWSTIRPELALVLDGEFDNVYERVHRGSSWTTDAPLRETATAIAAAEAAGVLAVEMEAAALYAYSTARQRDVVCVAHVTNTMAANGNDFEKGEDNGTHRILGLVDEIARRVMAAKTSRELVAPRSENLPQASPPEIAQSRAPHIRRT